MPNVLSTGWLGQLGCGQKARSRSNRTRIALNRRSEAALTGLMTCALSVLACTGATESAPTFRHTVTISRNEYIGARRLNLESMVPLCVPAGVGACELRELRSAAASATIGAILVGPGGTVQVHDTAGRWVRSIGSPGTQAGQYRDPAAMLIDRGGTLRIYDMGSLQLLTFDTLGKLVATARMPVPVGLKNLATAPQLGPTGVLYFEAPGGDVLGAPVEGTFVRAEPSAAIARRQMSVITRAQSVIGRDLQPARPFFMARPEWAIDPDGGVVFTNADSAILVRFDSAGHPDLRIRIDAPIVAPTPADIDVEMRRQIGGFSTPAWRARAKLQLERAARAATSFPAVSALRILEDHSILVRGVAPPSADSLRWDVIDREGRLLGYFRLERSSLVIGGRLSRVLVVARDSSNIYGEWLHIATNR